MITTRMSRCRPVAPERPGHSAGLRVAGRLHLERAVRRLACLVVVALAAPGCLLVDPVDQRPAIDIRLDTPGVIHRGQVVQLEAVGHDPEGQSIYYHWQVVACAAAPADCDAMPFFTGTEPSAAFPVPAQRVGGSPVQAVFVQLEGTDSGGAAALPPQQLVIALEDQPPTVDVAPRTATLVRGTSLPVFATVADPDDDPAFVQLAWKVFPPAGAATYTLTDYTGALPPGQVGKVLAPADDDASLGTWDVRATATDPLAMTASTDAVVNVVPDAPPCLSQWQPIAPSDPGDALPISEPTLFEVEHVIDDLDPYPASATGETTFAWSLEGPGDTSYATLDGATDNRVALDPATYAPGDIVELRVEIFDRAHGNPPGLPCDATDPTCSLTGDSCLQRLTWRVEMR